MKKSLVLIRKFTHHLGVLGLLIMLAACDTNLPPSEGANPNGVSLATAQPTATSTPFDITPLVTAVDSAVNLRRGPGTQYDIVAVLPQGSSLPVVGRNSDTSWWYVATSEGDLWIAASVTEAKNVGDDIPVVAIPPTPTAAIPTSTPLPTATPIPAFQYTIRNVFGQVNEAITQVRGDIRDINGNPVNGVRVRVRAGSFCTISFPSGPAGGYAAGGYDILLDNRAKDGVWQVSIVNGPANGQDTQCNGGLGTLSEEVSVPTNILEGVVFVEWQKNY
ncbi:MAG: SH3 domain-containing protein [Chloroflexota bacterium]